MKTKQQGLCAQTRREKLLIPAILLAFFFLMLFLNARTFLTMDDFLLSLSLKRYRRIYNIPEIFESLRKLRLAFNGRVIAHFFAQLFLFWPKWIFNLLNAAVSTLFFYGMYRFVRGDSPRKNALLLLFLMALEWLLLPAFGQIFLWLTGACNYSWSIVFSLLFLFPYYARFRDGAFSFRPGLCGLIQRLLFLLLAFVAGAYSENGSLAMLFLAFSFLVLDFLRERKLRFFPILAFLTACGGFLFLMLAPSELSGRKGQVSESTLTKAASRLWAVLTRFVSPRVLIVLALAVLLALLILLTQVLRRRKAALLLFRLLLWAAMLLVLAAAWLRAEGGTLLARRPALLNDIKLTLPLALGLYLLFLLRAWEKGVRREALLAALAFGAAGILSIAVFFFAVYFPARSACPFITYTTLADALLLSELWEKKAPAARALLAAGLILAMLAVLPAAVQDVLATYRQSMERDAYLRWAEVHRPDEVIYVEPITPRTKYSACWPGDASYFDEDISIFYHLYRFHVTEYID